MPQAAPDDEQCPLTDAMRPATTLTQAPPEGSLLCASPTIHPATHFQSVVIPMDFNRRNCFGFDSKP